MSDMEDTFSFLSSLFFTFFFNKLCKYADSRPNGKCDIPVRFLLDEFCNIGTIPDVNRKISTLRSRDISMCIVTQSLDQLQSRYLKCWQEIIGNCDTKIILGANDILTADYIRDLVGITTIKNSSFKREAGFDGNLNLGQENIAVAKRHLLNSDELLRLNTNKLITLIRGKNPVLLDKFYYLDHPLAKNLQIELITNYNKKHIQKEHIIGQSEKITKEVENPIRTKKEEQSNGDPLDTF